MRSRIGSLPLGLLCLQSSAAPRERDPGIRNKNDAGLKEPPVPTSRFSSVASAPAWLTGQQNFNSNKPECASGQRSQAEEEEG